MPRILIFTLLLSACALSQTVKVAPYYAAVAGAPLTTAATTDTSMDWLAVGQTERMLMPRTGSITRVRLYLGDKSNLSALYIGVCRWTSGTTWSVVQWSPAITGPFFSDEANVFAFASPIPVNKFDVMCGRVEWSTPHAENLATISSVLMPAISGQGNSVLAEKCYSQLNQPKPSSFTTGSMALIPANGCPVIEAWMARPGVVGIGDSIIEQSDSFAAGASAIQYPIGASSGQTGESVASHVADAYGLTMQGMGWGGQTTANIQSRFAKDALSLRAPYLIVNGGVNDLYFVCSTSGCTAGQINTIAGNVSAMMQAAQASGQKMFYILTGPWNAPNGTNGRMASADAINSQISGFAEQYGATIIDARCVLGQFRAGGPEGNCWDFQAQYLSADGLGVHPNQAGRTAMANLIQLPTTKMQSAGVTARGGGVWQRF